MMNKLCTYVLVGLWVAVPVMMAGCGGSSDGKPLGPDAATTPDLLPATPDVTRVSPDLQPDGAAPADLVPNRPDTAAPADVREVGGEDLPSLAIDAVVADLELDLGRDFPQAPDTPQSGIDAGPDAPMTTEAGIRPDTLVAPDTCVASCTGKYCGDSDGCGGTCPGLCQNGLSCCGNKCVALGSDPLNCGTCGKSCEATGQCSAGTCSTCTPDCTGKSCGSDGCGGLCGAACTGANPFCIQGSCKPCAPSCPVGAACGDSDGCGGRCQGTCASGTCTAGTCSTCTPSCTGKTCGDSDGCGGKCKTGSCPGGGTCGADGTCGSTCVPNCTGKLCGNNGCGGSCGNCVWPEICGDRSVLTTPTWTCVDQSFGCSTGVRAGYVDTAKYPGIAGCSTFVAGDERDLRKTRTDKWCGAANNNTVDFGSCLAAEDACSPGWHICGRNGAPKDITDRLTLADCLSSTEAAGGTFVAALSPIDVTSATCCATSAPTTFGCPNSTAFSGSVCEESTLFSVAAPVACGDSVSQTSSCSAFGGWSGAVPVDVSAGSCGSASLSWAEGMLCCKDPVKTGN